MNTGSIKKQFLNIYDSESDAVFRYCLIRTSSRELSIDMSQESFMRLWNAMYQNKKILNHRAFLFTIARNIIIDWYRKKKSVSIESLDVKFGEDSDSSVTDKLVLYDNSQEILEYNADGRYLLEKIKELDEPYSQVVYMRIVMDLKPNEISKILDESVNVVSVRISRGLEKMKKIYGVENLKKYE